jgi:hypothetical protein
VQKCVCEREKLADANSGVLQQSQPVQIGDLSIVCTPIKTVVHPLFKILQPAQISIFHPPLDM